MRTRKPGKDKIDKGRLVRTLQQLVRIPSFEDSVEVSKYVNHELEGFGYDVLSDSDGNLICEIGKGPGFLLNAHLDTVAPGDGWKHDPFGGKVEKGRVYGRGSSDCKAGVASIIEIARILKKAKLNKRIVFTCTAFEEGYPMEKNGVYKILPKLKDIEAGIILEPTTHGAEIGIAVGCRGAMRYNIRIKGTRAHSAYHPTTYNPIYKFPELLENIKNTPVKKMEIGMLGVSVEDRITVTQICAKEGPNVFPGTCEVTVDRRALPTETSGAFHKKIVSICKKSLGDAYEIEKISGYQGYLFDDAGFLDLCKKAIKSISGKPNPHFKLARTDSCILYNFAGIGTFMIGPGDMKQAHKKDEYCGIDKMYMATRAVLEVIKRWDNQG